MADSSDASPLRDFPGIAIGQPGVLPAWRTPLIGREGDLERLVALARQPHMKQSHTRRGTASSLRARQESAQP